MSKYRVVAESIYAISSGEDSLPGRRLVPLWDGDQQPTAEQLRSIASDQADVNESSKLADSPSIESIQSALQNVLGEDTDVPTFWPLLVQKRRIGRVLGFTTLGRVPVLDLLSSNEEFLDLEPVRERPIKGAVSAQWAKTSAIEKRRIKKNAAILSVGVMAVSAIGILDYLNTSIPLK